MLSFIISEIKRRNNQAEKMLNNFLNAFTHGITNPIEREIFEVEIICLYRSINDYCKDLNENDQLIVAQSFEKRDKILSLIHDLI